MELRGTWIPDGVALDKPSPARIYDYWLGGYHNFEADRIVGEQVKAVYEDTVPATYVARALLRRMVRFLVEEGIEQFLDFGSGLPTLGNVHETAQAINPAVRVVYTDVDPVAVTHGQIILADNPNAIYLSADVSKADQIIEDLRVREFLDFDRPIAALFLAVLHFIATDDKAYQVVRAVRDGLAPGSYVAISHMTLENAPAEILKQMQQLYANQSIPTAMRTRDQILQFFDGLELVEPGVVYSPQWRPEGPDDILFDQPERAIVYAGMGWKP
ncbi:MAG TPA: hypothetical protein ENN99_01375 [Chloroflexi bacterium]|nr:hypothetical protein [Chloroflexota bacterium]